MTTQLPTWRSHKVVQADKIEHIRNLEHDGEPTSPRWELQLSRGARVRVAEAVFTRGMPALGDYFVIYEGGYQSWSPAAVFETGYTRID